MRKVTNLQLVGGNRNNSATGGRCLPRALGGDSRDGVAAEGPSHRPAEAAERTGGGVGWGLLAAALERERERERERGRQQASVD